MKILTIGAAMRDLFVQCDAKEAQVGRASYLLIPAGKKTEVENIAPSIGGGAVNSALAYAKLGFKTSIFCKVGNDAEAAAILQQLQTHKINTKACKKDTQAHTGTSCIFMPPSGHCSTLVHRGANLTLKKSDIPYAAIKECDQLYITSLSKKTSALLPLIAQFAKQHKKRVACNPGTSQLTANSATLKRALPSIDILILNSYEASLLADALGISTKKSRKKEKSLPDLLAAPIATPNGFCELKNYFTTLLNCGPEIIVVTNDVDGVYVTDGSHIYYHPSLPVDVVSTIGAGDAFGATFTAQLAKGKSIEHAIRAGIINSASVIGQVDAHSGQLSQRELDARIKKMKQKIKTYSL